MLHSIKAAKAGAAGKGFAFAAEEVRSLAGKSAEAAEELNAKAAVLEQLVE